MCNKITRKQHEKPRFKQQKPVNTDAKACLYRAKGIKRKCETYVLTLFRKENSEQAAKQQLHKFYFEQKRVQNHNDTLHHKTAIMLTPYDTEPDCRRTEAGTETNIKAHGLQTAKSLGIRP